MIICMLLAESDAGWTHLVIAVALELTLWSFAEYVWRGSHTSSGARCAG